MFLFTGQQDNAFEMELKEFIAKNEINIESNDIKKLHDYLRKDLGALSMSDLVELTEEELKDERAGELW